MWEAPFFETPTTWQTSSPIKIALKMILLSPSVQSVFHFQRLHNRMGWSSDDLHYATLA